MHNLQFTGGSKPSQKPVSLVQMQKPVNTGSSVGALIAVWYSLFLDYAGLYGHVSTMFINDLLVFFRSI